MGRIKSALVKRSAKKMLHEENVFTEKFDDDKKILGHSMPSKRMRNKIAGYIARLKKFQQADQIKANQL